MESKPENKKPVNQEQSNIPEALKSEGTKVVSFKKMIDDALAKIEDLATLEVMMPVESRLRERMNSIQKMGAAKHLKIRGHWKTTPPKMHITKLTGKRLNSDEAEITFSVFEVDGENNKKVHEQSTVITKEDGSKIKRLTSAEYRIAYEVTEKIKTGKTISREVVQFELK
jgi:mRNA-degrading endonuclease RelE of RelBE toxin-antitoxin system